MHAIWTILLTLAIFLEGCAATARQTYTPDGQIGYVIDCPVPIGLDWADCYKEAGRICGQQGYDILKKEGGDIGGNLLIKCK